jgi:hypothetical protein
MVRTVAVVIRADPSTTEALVKISVGGVGALARPEDGLNGQLGVGAGYSWVGTRQVDGMHGHISRERNNYLAPSPFE